MTNAIVQADAPVRIPLVVRVKFLTLRELYRLQGIELERGSMLERQGIVESKNSHFANYDVIQVELDERETKKREREARKEAKMRAMAEIWLAEQRTKNGGAQ